MKKISPEPKDQVTLRPIFGISPTRYVPMIYGAIVVVILFLILVLPGIINYGSHIRIPPELSEAGIWIDDTYVSSVSNTPFIEAGTYTITVKKPFFEPIVMEEVSVPGRLFFSLFSKKTHTIPVEWQLNNTQEYLENSLEALGNWAPVEEYSERYHYPEILSSAAEDMVAGGAQDSRQVRKFFLSAMGFVTNETMYRDLSSALESLPTASSSAITQSQAFHLLSSYYDDDRGTFEEYVNRVITSGTDHDPLETLETIHVDERAFIRIPAADQVVLGDADISFSDGLQKLPYLWSAESYYIGSQEVTERMYADFVRENSEWELDNRRNLRQKGLVDQMYLKDINLFSPSDRPIRNISAHAAQAYAEWYSQKLESNGTPYRASLPTEQQWEYAALLTAEDTGYADRLLVVEDPSAQVYGMFGSVWELTRSPYIPLAGMTRIQQDMQASAVDDLAPELDRTVKGGSYVNDPVTAYERGSIDRSACSPYIGFRLVLEEKEHE
ncbi:MAG: formylglycine-generating enzyme family protein [Spirochaetota bacterium]